MEIASDWVSTGPNDRMEDANAKMLATRMRLQQLKRIPLYKRNAFGTPRKHTEIPSKVATPATPVTPNESGTTKLATNDQTITKKVRQRTIALPTDRAHRHAHRLRKMPTAPNSPRLGSPRLGYGRHRVTIKKQRLQYLASLKNLDLFQSGSGSALSCKMASTIVQEQKVSCNPIMLTSDGCVCMQVLLDILAATKIARAYREHQNYQSLGTPSTEQTANEVPMTLMHTKMARWDAHALLKRLPTDKLQILDKCSSVAAGVVPESTGCEQTACTPQKEIGEVAGQARQEDLQLEPLSAVLEPDQELGALMQQVDRLLESPAAASDLTAEPLAREDSETAAAAAAASEDQEETQFRNLLKDVDAQTSLYTSILDQIEEGTNDVAASCRSH